MGGSREVLVRRAAWFGLACLLGGGCDLQTKAWAEQTLGSARGSRMIVEPWLELSLAYNRGTAFSFVPDLGATRWIFGVFALAMVVVLLVFALRSPGHRARPRHDRRRCARQRDRSARPPRAARRHGGRRLHQDQLPVGRQLADVQRRGRARGRRRRGVDPAQLPTRARARAGARSAAAIAEEPAPLARVAQHRRRTSSVSSAARSSAVGRAHTSVNRRTSRGGEAAG